MPPALVAATSYYLPVTRTVVGTPVTVQRPNNVNAYAAGQVFGTAADGRFTLVSPALPTNAQLAGFSTLTCLAVESRAPADPSLPTVWGYLCLGGFTTVLGDQVAMALNDADIDNLVTQAGQVFAFSLAINTGTGSQTLNASAGVNGRRGLVLAFAAPNGIVFPPLTKIGVYFVVSAAYTPAALETLTLIPWWSYAAKVTLP